MRALILLAGAAIMLGACGKGAQSDNSANVDDSLTAENIVANDVTAIDAVTGDAANMAADVNYENFADNSLDNAEDSLAPAKPSKPKRPAATERPKDRVGVESAPANAATNNAT